MAEQRYVVAVDGSSGTEQTLDYCQERFDSDRVRVDVLNVIQPMSSELNQDLIETPSLGEMEKLQQQRAKQVVQTAAERLETVGFDVKQVTRTGHPGREICDLADDQQFDGIVIGRKGHTAIGEVLLGSTSHFVLQHAPCPVIVVPLDAS